MKSQSTTWNIPNGSIHIDSPTQTLMNSPIVTTRARFTVILGRETIRTMIDWALFILLLPMLIVVWIVTNEPEIKDDY